MKTHLGMSGPSLIMCPLSVISSWMNEFKKWAPSLKVVRLHCGEDERESVKRYITDNFTDIDAIVTTYDQVKVDPMTNFLKRYHFNTVVLDEGHIIKNHEALISIAVRKLRSATKIILTGTPLQNNLVELWAMINYLYPEYFPDKEPFQEAFE